MEPLRRVLRSSRTLWTNTQMRSLLPQAQRVLHPLAQDVVVAAHRLSQPASLKWTVLTTRMMMKAYSQMMIQSMTLRFRETERPAPYL
jgi:hypothetical protein